MTTPVQATIGQEIHERLIQAIWDGTHYWSTSSRNFTSIVDDLDKLGKVDAAERSLLMILLYGLAGDREQAEYYARNAGRIFADPGEIKLCRMGVLVNLGYATEALHEMRKFDLREHGLPRYMMACPPGNGAFHTINAMFDLATEMNIMNLPDRASLPEVVEIMDSWGDTDDDYSAALDIAGKILREKRLFFKNNMVIDPVKVPADGGAGYVRLVYRVAVDFDTSLQMTSEYIDRLARSGHKIPPSLVFEFEGVEA